MRRLAVIVCIFATITPVSFSATASFVGIGDLPGGKVSTKAYGLSADGTTVVGYSSFQDPYDCQAFRWKNGEMIGIGFISGGSYFSDAHGVSYNGDVVVGRSNAGGGYYPFLWEDGQMKSLGNLGGPGANESMALNVSPDGKVAVGLCKSSTGKTEAFRWEADQMVGLGHLGGNWSCAYDISADKSIIAGTSKNAMNTNEAFIYTNNSMSGLGDLAGGVRQSAAFAISADGSTIVGRGKTAKGDEAFIWKDGVMANLNDFSNTSVIARTAKDVSADGSVVIGITRTGNGNTPFIWKEEIGVVLLKDYLHTFDIELGGWKLTDVVGISDNGYTIAGNGINPQGNNDAWIVTIPEPTTVLLLSLGAVMMRRK